MRQGFSGHIPDRPLAGELILSFSEYLGGGSEMHLRDAAESVSAVFCDDGSSCRFDRGRNAFWKNDS
jgi:hypothetical protein